MLNGKLVGASRNQKVKGTYCHHHQFAEEESVSV
jgi:hypothetical protein